MHKALKILLGFLIVITLIEGGYYLYLTNNKKNAATQLNTVGNQKTGIISPTVAVVPGRSKWDLFLKKETYNKIYEGRLKKVVYNEKFDKENDPLDLFFEEGENLGYYITAEEWQIVKIYEEKDGSFIEYDGSLLKAGDTIELRLVFEDGDLVEITVIKKDK